MAADPYAQFQDATGDPFAQFPDAVAAVAAAPPPASPPRAAASSTEYNPTALAGRGNPYQTNPTSGAGAWLNSNVVNPLVRAAYKAGWALPGMSMDLGVAGRNVLGNAYNTVAGNPATPNYELPSATFNRALDSVTQAPTTTAGKASEVANTIVMGLMAPGLAPTYANASNVPAGFTAPATTVPKNFVRPGATSGLTAAEQNAADAGQGLGMQLTPGQETGSRALQQFEAKLQAQPWTSGPFNKLGASNQRALNAAWTGTSGGIGEGGTSLDSTVLARAADRTGEIFNSARNANSIVAADPKTTSGVLDAIDQEFEGLIPGSIRANPLVSKFESLTGQGAINGEQLGNLSSKLGRAANNQMTSPAGDRELGQALYAVKDHADDLLQSTLTGQDAAAYVAARQQYRALMQLSARPGNVNPSTGNVGGTSLANYLQTKDKGGFLFGRNQSDAYNAARFAQAFKPIVGDSGTATRSSNLNLGNLMQLPLTIPANLFSRAYLSGPGSAAVRGLMSAPDLLRNGASPELLSGLMTGIASSQPSLWTPQK